MELREIRSLCTLADTGSLSSTARMLHLSPAAVHKQLRQLEAELQIPIYERRQGRLRLTAAADLLIPYLRDMLGQYETALGAMEEWRGLRRGLLRIGAGPSLATYVLPEVLYEFHRKWPQVEIDVQTGSSLQLIESLRSGTVDLALVVAPESMEEEALQVVVEKEAEIVLVTSLRDVPVRAKLQSLTGLPFLLFRKGSRIENLIERYWASRRFVPDVVMRFDSAEALKATLRMGAGVAMLPVYTVADDLRSGLLRRLRSTDPPLMMKLHLLARRAGYTPPAVSAFTTMAQNLFTRLR